jgi:hypothetical protein
MGANNIVLNCAGHTITGTGTIFDSGVMVGSPFSHVEVKNCHITGFYYDINAGSTSNKFVNNIVDNAPGYGFFIYLASDNLYLNNKIIQTGSGMLALDSTDNVFANNFAKGNGYNGITMASDASGSSTGNKLINNIAKDNTNYGFGDDTTGSGTAGTGSLNFNNFCEDNIAGTSSPLGLCQTK